MPGSSCTCTGVASSSTTSTCTTGRAAGSPTGSVWRSSASTTGWLRSTGSRPRPDDVNTVLGWLDRAGAALGLAGPAYVHGDSAGGNLALVAALRHPGRFRAVVLHYPFLDPRAGFESYAIGAAAAFDPREAAWYWQQYAAGETELADPDLAPLLSDRLGSLPPTLVTTAEHDPLRDEGEHLAALIAEAGGDVTCTRYLGQIHGYWRHAAFPASEQAILHSCAFLRGH